MITLLNSMRPSPLAGDAGSFHLNFRRHLVLCLMVVLLSGELDYLIWRRLGLSSNLIENKEPTSGSRLANSNKIMRVKLAKAAEIQTRNLNQLNVEPNPWDSMRYNQNHHQFHQTPPQSLGGGSNLQLDQASTNNNNNHNYYEKQLPQLNDDTDDEFNLIEIVLSYIDYWMPTVNLNYTLNYGRRFPAAQLDSDVENYYVEQYPNNMTLEELQLSSVKAALRVAPMPLSTSWGYESRAEMRMSSLPVQSDSRCAAHLDQLSQRLDSIMTSVQSPTIDTQVDSPGQAPRHRATPVENLEANQLYKSQDLQMLRYMDTFGHVPSDLLRGNVKWYGSYDGCLDTKLKANPSMGGTRRMKFRYCLGSLKSINWRRAGKQLEEQQRSYSLGTHDLDNKLDNYFLRVGLCLPESCDSSVLEFSKENGETIEKLLKFNLLKPFNSDHYYLSDLYCLPDLRSPLRTIPLFGKLLILVSLGWLGLIALATSIHLNVEKFYTKAVREIRRKQKMDELIKNYEQNGTANESDEETRVAISAASIREREMDGENQANEFKESDILHLKQNWIRLNVFVWDKFTGGRGSLWPGVDFIQCLSLYSNWLKYTNKLKLSVAQLHLDEQRRARIKLRNQQLVERVRSKKTVAFANSPLQVDTAAAAATTTTSQLPTTSQLRKTTPSTSNVNNGSAPSANFDFDRELSRRLVVKDEVDEMESDTIKKRVDTSSLNALKVIALVWIIAGHCIFYLVGAIENGAMLKKYVRNIVAFALANGAMYITELFFVITGCLSAYLAFKYNTYKLAVPFDSDNDIFEAHAGNRADIRTNLRTDHTKSTNLEGEEGASLKGKCDTGSTNGGGASGPETELAYLEHRIFRAPFWLLMIINRYLRILPTYLVVYAWVKLVSVYVGGYGPTWDYAVSANSMRRACVQESWLPVLSLTTNFVDIYRHCIVGGWYLSADMQFMVMAAPLLALLAACQRKRSANSAKSKVLPPISLNNSSMKQQVSYSQKQQQLTFINSQTNSPSASPDALVSDQMELRNDNGSGSGRDRFNRENQIKLDRRLIGGYLVIVLLALASGLLAIIYGIFMSQLDLGYILKFVPHAVAVLSKNIAMYTNSVFRFRAFAFGLILGHLLYLHEFNLIRLPKFIQQHGSKITSIAATIGFLLMFLPVLYPKDKLIISHDVTVILMILTATGVDLFLCLLIFLVCIGKAPKFALFLLNSPFWSVLSSLSLCAFLVHTEIIILLTTRLMPLPSVQYSALLLFFCATLILTYSLALGLHLTFEMPVSRLIDTIMRKYVSKSRTKKEQENELVRSDTKTAGVGSLNNNK